MHAELYHDRQENGRKDQNRRRHVHEGADDQEQHIDDEENDDLVIRQRQKRRADFLGNLLHRHDPCHAHGRGDQEHHDGRSDAALEQNLRQLLQLHFLVENDGQEKRIGHRDGCRFRGRENAE